MPKRNGTGTIGIAVALAVTVALVGLAVYGLNHSFNLKNSRTHLKPIPIAASACPYVVLMHATANAFQSAEPILGAYIDSRGNVVEPPWPQVHARVLAALLNLQAAIFVATRHFPPPIRHQLTVTLDAIHIGLNQLAVAQDATYLGNSDALKTGQAAFGYASDLVGTQCSVQLGANSQIAQPLPTPTVSTHR